MELYLDLVPEVLSFLSTSTFYFYETSPLPLSRFPIFKRKGQRVSHCKNLSMSNILWDKFLLVPDMKPMAC